MKYLNQILILLLVIYCITTSIYIFVNNKKYKQTEEQSLKIQYQIDSLERESILNKKYQNELLNNISLFKDSTILTVDSILVIQKIYTNKYEEIRNFSSIDAANELERLFTIYGIK